MGFSRTPVREAVTRLGQEGLLKVFPKRGIMVSGISISDIHKIFEVRSLVEPYAVRKYHQNLDREEMKRFLQIFQTYSQGEQDPNFYDLDDSFHAMMISAMENDYLLELYDRIHAQSTRLRIMSGNAFASRIQDTMQEHTRIAEACLAEDWEEAAQAMAEHLRYSQESSLAAILKNNAPDL